MYIYALSKINNIFFTFNNINYARWLAWYINNLLNIDNTHPGLKKNITFGVKRTDKPFSTVPLDLTLEQTINAEAGRRLTGIMHLTNSISARARWAINHGLRCALISFALNISGLSSKNDITNDLFTHRINRGIADMNKVIVAFNDRINPFCKETRKDVLCNISTGQSVSNEISDFLLNVEAIGEKQKIEFLDKCAVDEENFDKYVIKKNKILNFASESKQKKVKKSVREQEVRLQKDLFGRLLCVSLDHNIDISKVMLI